MNDKRIEANRYDLRAKTKLNSNIHQPFPILNSHLNQPYEAYQEMFKVLPKGSQILEIGAGMGENTEFLLKLGFKVCSTDISSKSVEVMQKRFCDYDNFVAKEADMELLPFENNSFDIVCSAGSLSYGDNLTVMNEIYRVLNQTGSFIAVDSLNNNLIYRLNRYINYLMAKRTKSTLLRMPNIKLIKMYEKKFGSLEVNYYGSLTWLYPFLKIFIKEQAIKNLLYRFDKKFSIKRSAFKFTMKTTKI